MRRVLRIQLAWIGRLLSRTCKIHKFWFFGTRQGSPSLKVLSWQNMIQPLCLIFYVSMVWPISGQATLIMF